MVKSFPLCVVLLSAFCSLADCPPPDMSGKDFIRCFTEANILI